MSVKKPKLATIFSSLLLLVAVLLPGSAMPQVEVIGIDKLAHVLLLCFWALALRFDWQGFRRRPWLLLAAGAAAALLTEALQLLVAGRSCEAVDMAADLVGAALAAAFGGPAVRAAERRAAGRAARRTTPR
jgi:VanZ family protein